MPSLNPHLIIFNFLITPGSWRHLVRAFQRQNVLLIIDGEYEAHCLVRQR